MKNITKKIAIIVAATGILTTALLHTFAQADNYPTYRNDVAGFQIAYLDNWHRFETPTNSLFAIKRDSSNKPCTLSIDVRNFTGNQKTIIDKMVANVDKQIATLKRRFPDIKKIEAGNTELGNWPAAYWAFTYTLKNLGNQLPVFTIQVFCVKDQKAYLVQIEGVGQMDPTVINEADRIISTFMFTK